jgi:hypothetical protein
VRCWTFLAAAPPTTTIQLQLQVWWERFTTVTSTVFGLG